MSLPQIITAAAFGWIGYQFFGKKKRKKSSGSSSSDAPTLDCGLYKWRPVDVDRALDEALDTGERDAESIALLAAREVYPVTPEGPPQPWPPQAGDVRGHCLLDRIRIRVNLRLAELVDGEADDDDPGGAGPDEPLPRPPIPRPPIPRPPIPRPPGPPKPIPPLPVPPGPTTGPAIKPPSSPEEPPPFDEPEEPEPSEWPDYPPPGPVDLSPWTDPGNYPNPGKFHQIGGPNSATTLQAIARKALTTAFYLVHGDLELAVELAKRSENWRAYREAINCSAWNHALYGSTSEPGTSGGYVTPHGDQISMYPAHANVASQLANGEPPQRRVRLDNPKLPPGGRHALIWLPVLDESELLEGRVKIKHDHWWTGDWVTMPPPEVLALGVVDVAPGTWGCGGYETSYDFEEGE